VFVPYHLFFPFSSWQVANWTLHLGVDVNIYASSTKDAWPLIGNHENTDVGSFIADYLDLDLQDITKKLIGSSLWSGPFSKMNANNTVDEFSWMGDPLGDDIRVDQLDSYHGDFRKRSNGDEFVPTQKRSCGCGAH
jgi:alkaline phosphatase